MKKSELKKIILEEVKGVLKEGYYQNEILQLLQSVGDNPEFSPKMKIMGGNGEGSTKWFNVSVDVLRKLAELMSGID